MTPTQNPGGWIELMSLFGSECETEVEPDPLDSLDRRIKKRPMVRPT